MKRLLGVFIFYVLVILMFNQEVFAYRDVNESCQETIYTSDLPKDQVLKNSFEDIFCIDDEPSFNKVAILDTAFRKFLAGDINAMLELAADNFVLEISGPSSDTTHYGTYYGKEGLIDFCLKAYGLFVVEDFNILYYVSEGYDVNVLIREKFYFNHSGAYSIAEFNEHIKFNEEGKITYFGIIQDTYNQLLAIGGNENELYEIDNPNSEYNVNNYYFPSIYNRIIAFMMFDAISTGDTKGIKNILSSDVEFVIGNKNIAPYSGKFSGKSGIKQFIRRYTAEMESMEIIKIVCENNKAEINFTYNAKASETGNLYAGNAKFSFQLNKKGKIARCYYFFDQYSTYKAYSRDVDVNVSITQ